MIGLGKQFFDCVYRRYDFVIALLSTIATIYEMRLIGTNSFIGMNNAIRTLRIGRIFKQFKRNPKLKSLQ